LTVACKRLDRPNDIERAGRWHVPPPMQSTSAGQMKQEPIVANLYDEFDVHALGLGDSGFVTDQAKLDPAQLAGLKGMLRPALGQAGEARFDIYVQHIFAAAVF